MCYKHLGFPYVLVLDQWTTKTDIEVLTFGLVFGKVADYRHDMHRTTRDFKWPIGQTVRDPRARVGHHDYGLHFFASPAYAQQENRYRGHVLAVLPSPQVWHPAIQLPTPEMLKQPQQPRCYHSSGATILACLTCSGMELDVLSNPDFLRDLKRPRSLPGGRTITDLLTENVIWQQQVEINRI
jgi:hypothetical protein